MRYKIEQIFIVIPTHTHRHSKVLLIIFIYGRAARVY